MNSDSGSRGEVSDRSADLEVVIWNDRLEIFYRHREKEGPDGDRRQALPFYHCTKSFEVDFQRIGRDPFVLTYGLDLFI